MFDDQVVEEHTEQEVTEHVPETVQEAPAEQAVEQRVEKPNDINIRKLRENAERLERERDEAVKLAQELQQQSQQPEEDYEVNLADDDFAEGKHLSKIGRKIKRLEEQLAQYQQASTTSAAELKLKSQYPDFDNVVNQTTINKLRNEYPDIAASLHANQDFMSKASSAYTLIKKLGLYTEDNYQPDRERAQANMAKPRAAASMSPQTGESPLTKANAFSQGLTPELKNQLYKEMLEASEKA